MKRQQLRRELGIPLDATVLLSVGEVNRNKNHALVLRTLPKLECAYYVICGAGPLMKDLRALSEKLNVSERFIMAGYRTDIADFYRMADIFLFPSLREGLGMALLEALACGLPALAMNTRGPADIIRDGENGFLMENNVDAWVDKIRNLCQNPEVFSKLRSAARDSVSQFDINRVLPMVRALYANISLNKSKT
ncbi:MAG: glycosyltransferase family 4 protein [Oscillibacter sp.]|nr:glycosyltransferase family 4 protein [Oscillibacter sp.]